MIEQTLPAAPAGQQDITAGVAAGGAIPTVVDVTQLVATLQHQMLLMQQQMEALQAQGPSGPHPLIATAANLAYHLNDVAGLEAHAPIVGLAADLTEAAANAVSSGDLTHVHSIVAKVQKWFARHPARTGDDHHGQQAREIAAYHLPDVIDAFVPAPKAPALAGAAPVPVVAGSVVG